MIDLEDNSPCGKIEQEIKEIKIDELKKTHHIVVAPDRYSHKFRNCDENYVIKNTVCGFMTCNYVGIFTYENEAYNIGCRFGDELLKEMLKVVGGVLYGYLGGSKRSKAEDFSERILYISFLKALKLASLNGFYKGYQKSRARSFGFSGKLDTNAYAKAPFASTLPCVKTELIDDYLGAGVLLAAYNEIRKNAPDLAPLAISIVAALKQISKPIKDLPSIKKALNRNYNQAHKYYKMALELASLIIFKHSCGVNLKSKFGYLLYVPDLFEAYVESLLKRVANKKGATLKTQQKIKCKSGNVYRADFVMQIGNNKIVIDAKYRHFFKNMKNIKNDIKNIRQINSYIGAFNADAGLLIYAKNSAEISGLISKCGKPIYTLSVMGDDDAIDIKSFEDRMENIIKIYLKENK